MVLTESETYAKIGQRVKKYRTERGMSQDQLAEGICSRQTIGFLEHGRHLPSVDFLQKIADRLSIPLHEIMVDETKELEAKVQLDIVKVYIERGEYKEVFPLIEGLEQREDLLEYQKREVTLCRAECLMRTGKADIAIEILTKMQQELEMKRESDDHMMAIIYDKLGTAYFYLSNISNAHAYYMRAYQTSIRFPEFDLTSARITFNYGKVCRMMERHMEAIEYLTRVEDFFSKNSDVKRLALTLFELGIAYTNQNRTELAKTSLEKSLALYESMNILNMMRRVRESYAYNVLSQTKPEQAIEEIISCAEDFKKEGDTPQLAFTYARAAELYMCQGKDSEAEVFLQRSLSLFNEESGGKNPRYAYAYFVYAKFLLKTNMFSDCVHFSYKASDFFDKMGLERDAAETLKVSSEAYRLQGMFEQADKVSQRIIELLSRSNERYTTVLGAFS